MSISVCAITGQALQHPVASLKTGHLFEKEIIEKHLNSFPYCPITNQAMSSSDIVDIVGTPLATQPTADPSRGRIKVRAPSSTRSRTSTTPW